MDGSEFSFAPYDFSYWTKAELEVMGKHLAREKKWLRRGLEFEAEVAMKARLDLSTGQTAANTMNF